MVPTHLEQHRKLSVIIPLFNEEENLPLTAEGIFSVLGSDPNFLELVLILRALGWLPRMRPLPGHQPSVC